MRIWEGRIVPSWGTSGVAALDENPDESLGASSWGLLVLGSGIRLEVVIARYMMAVDQEDTLEFVG